MTLPPGQRDHSGNLSDAMDRWGGAPGEWMDLSTGINPDPWPAPPVSAQAWTRLPDADLADALRLAARRTYNVPKGAQIVAAPGASALIRQVPRLTQSARVAIPGPTYNEHAAAFRAEGWDVTDRPGPGVTASVIVNPNNPDGRRWSPQELQLLAEALDLLIVDESFMDPTPERSAMHLAGLESLVILRSFGKFYGLAGLRLGFAMCAPSIAARLADLLGPWAVSGPALEIGVTALSDDGWAAGKRDRLSAAADRLRALGRGAGWTPVGGTSLFQTFETPDAAVAQERLAQHRIWSRIFPYSPTWLRLGLPPADGWGRLERALA